MMQRQFIIEVDLNETLNKFNKIYWKIQIN